MEINQIFKRLCIADKLFFKLFINFLIQRCFYKTKINCSAWLFERTCSFHTLQVQILSLNLIKMSRTRKQKTYYCLMYEIQAEACHSNWQLGETGTVVHGPALCLPLYYPGLHMGGIFLVVGNWSICQFDCFCSIFKLLGEDCMCAVSE